MFFSQFGLEIYAQYHAGALQLLLHNLTEHLVILVCLLLPHWVFINLH